VDANEIAFLSMDNIWRANQLYFMVGPVYAFSLFTGFKNFNKYALFGQDISGAGRSSRDATRIAINLVKYWTTFLILACISCWLWRWISNPVPIDLAARRPGCIVFTFIAMDVLHPCVYLWTINNDITEARIAKMGWRQCFMSSQFWKFYLAKIVLNHSVTNVFRFVAPVYNLLLPILVFQHSSYGVGGAFSLVTVGVGH